ncbi:MAG: PHP domain-containing protein [Arenicella sp.]
MKVDLHCHSHFSDGTLTPTEVVDLAVKNDVELLALTDHDSVQGLEEARQRCQFHGIKMIDGVEISVSWNGYSIHVVGLNIDDQHPNMIALLEKNAILRHDRVVKMIEKLQAIDLDVMPYLNTVIPDNGLITRTHLGRALVEIGAVNKMDKAFKKYLGKGKCAYVEGNWVSLSDAVQAIIDSGGDAVIAHPMRYRIGATRLDALVSDFAKAGGKGLEVVTATQDVNQQRRCLQLAEQYQLQASIGSDFHSLDQPWAMLGRCPSLPAKAIPIWQNWSD